MKSRRTNHIKPFTIALGIGFSLVILTALTFAVVNSRLNYQSKAALITRYMCVPSGECFGTVVSTVYCGSTCRNPNQCCKTTRIVNSTPTPTPTLSCVRVGANCGAFGAKPRCCAGIICAVSTGATMGKCISGTTPTRTLTPPSVAGRACTTRVGWPGKCTLVTACNTTLNTAWDILGSPCNGVGNYGCCGNRPSPTPTPTPRPTIFTTLITSGTCEDACIAAQARCLSVGYNAEGTNNQIMSYDKYYSCTPRNGVCRSTVQRLNSPANVKCINKIPEWTFCRCQKNPFAN